MKNYLYAAFLLLLIGCSGRPVLPDSNSYADSYRGVSKEHKIFVAPVQEGFKGLEEGGDIVLKEIGKQLEAKGWKVATTSKENYLNILGHYARSVGGLYSPVTGMLNQKKYNYVLREVVKSIGQSGDFAAVIVPSFSLKTAELEGRHASWDGVKRLKVAEGRYSTNMSWSGNTKGLSLELIVFTPEGEWLFTSYGGLVLPFRTVVKDGRPANELRENMFESDRDIQSGVGVALAPIVDPSLTMPSI